jgi:lactoylglutathione lyase
MFTSAFPIVSTRDLSRALTFYRDLLSGKVTYQFPAEGDPGYVALDLGSSHLGLGLDPSAPTGAQRISLWLYTDDCDAAIAHLRAAGTMITEEPTSQPWGERVARCLDPDGNEIIIGSPAPPDTDPAPAR